MRIRATLRYMAASEISAMIPAARLAEIKRTDPAPTFKAFVVGHEGEARGNLLGIGNVVKRWFRAAVEKLHEKIAAGLQLFHGHAETNSTEGRVPIGEVVGKRLLSIKDRLSTVVACYIYPHYRHLPLDVASIEADVDLEQNEREGLYVADVTAVTAIALGNSEIETPGFPGATLLGTLQAFARDARASGQEDRMDLDDVRAFIKAERCKPSDLFEREELTADPDVHTFVKSEIKAGVDKHYAFRKDSEEALEKAKKDFADKLKAKDNEISTLRLEGAKDKIPSLFERQRETRKLDEKQVKFLKIQLPKYKPANPEDLEKDFNSYLDAQIEEYGRIAQELGLVEKKTGDEDKDKRGTGNEPAKNEAAGGEGKYTNPATNPMIKTD